MMALTILITIQIIATLFLTWIVYKNGKYKIPVPKFFKVYRFKIEEKADYDKRIDYATFYRRYLWFLPFVKIGDGEFEQAGAFRNESSWEWLEDYKAKRNLKGGTLYKRID